MNGRLSEAGVAAGFPGECWSERDRNEMMRFKEGNCRTHSVVLNYVHLASGSTGSGINQKEFPSDPSFRCVLDHESASAGTGSRVPIRE
jgi:hypothetical protein